MPLIFWCLEPALGIRIGIMLLFSNWVNGIAKLSLHTSRPYWFDANVRAFISEESFGAPSGHAQNAASLWGLAAVSLRKTWVSILMAVIVLLIGFSRIYLGVHFFSDVILGLSIGVILLVLFLRFEHQLIAWLKTKTLGFQMTLSLFITGIIIITGLIPYWALAGWQMPTAWLDTISITSPDHLPNPVSASGIFTIAGTFLGLSTGMAWYLSKYNLYNVSGSTFDRLFRYSIGLVGILVIYIGLGQVFPRGETWLPLLFRLLRYGLIGLWISALAPWLFIQIKLSSSVLETSQ
jgi:hypothetical protein